MKKFIMTFILLFSSLTANSSWGSGSNTVFLPVRYTQYVIGDASRELAANPKLYDYIESSTQNIYIARVQPNYYKFVRILTVAGYIADIEFEYYETVTFRYFSGADAIIGFDSKGDMIILSE